jgi:hypothetical protein
MDSEPPLPPSPGVFPDAAQRQGPPEEGRDSFLRRVFLLFFRPGTFFAEMDAPKNQLWVAAFALTYGLSYTFDRYEMNQLRGRGGPFEVAGWPLFWGVLLPFAILAAAFIYSLGGAWYKFRVRLSGTPGADIRMVRRVYLSAAQIVAIPGLLYAIIKTFRYETPLDAALADPTWLDTAFLVFPFLSYYASFRGVRTVFKTRKVSTAIWFFVLPSLFLLFLIVLLAVGWSGAGSPIPPGPEPDLDYPREFSSAAMAFSYPGNWSLQEYNADYDTGCYARLNAFQDMLLEIVIITYEPGEDPGPESLADYRAEELCEEFGEPADGHSFIRWGALKGTGRRWTGESEGFSLQIRVFAGPLAENVYLLVTEIVHQEQIDMLEPGFSLVRSSFRPVR